MIILFHDDFDGIASAALVADFAKLRYGLQTTKYIPINYDVKPEWGTSFPFPEIPEYEIVAIVDFMYHPRAWMWFDHHPTTFKDDAAIAHFKERMSRQVSERPVLEWDTTFESCGRLVFEYVKAFYPHEYTKWGQLEYELAQAADLIDGANYESPQQYFAGEEPAIAINYALGRLSTGQRGELITRLQRHSLEQVRDFVGEQAAAEISTTQADLERYPEATQTSGGVAVSDLLDTNLRFLRFAPYYHDIDLDYGIHLYARGLDAGMSIGHNPWKPNKHVNLGDLAAAYGGGGHQYAAGIRISATEHASPHAEVRRIARELVTTLRTGLT